MKYLTIILLILGLSCSAQYNREKQQGAGAAFGIAIGGFTTNEIIMHTEYFDNLSLKRKDQVTLSIFATTAVTATLTGWLTPRIVKVFKARKNKRKWRKR